MGKKIKVNWYLKEETVKGIEILSKNTFRRKSDVIDWLVAEEMKRNNPILKHFNQNIGTERE